MVSNQDNAYGSELISGPGIANSLEGRRIWLISIKQKANSALKWDEATY